MQSRKDVKLELQKGEKMSKKASYLVLDCETATLPFIKELVVTEEERKKIAVARPIIYDIGWTIVQKDGTILKKASYLVQETFFVPQVFETAYYKSKRPKYIEKLNCGKIKTALWNDIMDELLEDCKKCNFVSAYNAAFDFKKAIPFTEKYIKALYSDSFDKFLRGQKWYLTNKEGAKTGKSKNSKYIKPDNDHFILRGEKFDLVDIWRLASEMVNVFNYKNDCAAYPAISNSGAYFKTSAEQVFRYVDNNYDFEEAHTALEDAEIETQILLMYFKRKKKIEKGIEAFPFRALGTTVDFATNPRFKNRISKEGVSNIYNAMMQYLQTAKPSTFRASIERQAKILETLL